jgi:Uma2 family endonuclease
MSVSTLKRETEDLLGTPPAWAFERKWTYKQALAQLPETLHPLEIWDGKLVMTATPFFIHQNVVGRFFTQLDRWVRARRLGVVIVAPMDCVLADDLVLQPDVMFIAKERARIIKGHVMGAPDLVVEVVSGRRRKRDYKDKRDRYEAHGVKEYWIVDPEENHIEIWGLNADAFFEIRGRYAARQFASSRLLAGFRVRVDRLLSPALEF